MYVLETRKGQSLGFDFLILLLSFSSKFLYLFSSGIKLQITGPDWIWFFQYCSYLRNGRIAFWVQVIGIAVSRK